MFAKLLSKRSGGRYFPFPESYKTYLVLRFLYKGNQIRFFGGWYYTFGFQIDFQREIFCKRGMRKETVAMNHLLILINSLTVEDFLDLEEEVDKGTKGKTFVSHDESLF